MSNADLTELWARYKAEPTREDREALILAHLPLVHYWAQSMKRNLHASVETQDLVSYGIFGLMDAIEKYDPGAGTKFSTFATYRIKGAITDEMRDQAWEPRSVRQRSRVVTQAMTDLEHILGRPPTEAEVAERLETTVGELRRLAGDMRMSRVASLQRPVGGDDQEFTLGDTLVSQDTPELSPEVREAAELMAEGLGLLPENERILVQMIYIKGMALKEIARVLEVTESWVSLLHTRAMVNLQRTLAAQF